MRRVLSLAALTLLAVALTPGRAAVAAEPYRVGLGDVLEVVVEGRADLSRLPTVQTTGGVFLPRAGYVEAAGLTTDEIEERIAPLLVAEDLPAPEVSVRVKEHKSQFVWVHGEVLHPGRKPLRGGTRLIDALLDAGGFTARASGGVTIHRQNGTFPDGGHSHAVRLSGADPTSQEIQELGLFLKSGDVIFVGTQHWVTVSGEVARPGRYPLENGLTLTHLIEQAGGRTPFGSDRVTVRRIDAAAGGASDIEANLKAIRSGDASDPVLAPGDQVAVATRGL
jgi:polysaccharide export outer membrane protein